MTRRKDTPPSVEEWVDLPDESGIDPAASDPFAARRSAYRVDTRTHILLLGWLREQLSPRRRRLSAALRAWMVKTRR